MNYFKTIKCAQNNSHSLICLAFDPVNFNSFGTILLNLFVVYRSEFVYNYVSALSVCHLVLPVTPECHSNCIVIEWL